MCGIGGIITYTEQLVYDTVDVLTGALSHRGPDGSSSYISNTAGLMHTRLAIVDLVDGMQPFKHGGLSLVANGEVYNYAKLWLEFDYTLCKSKSDCEPPLYLYFHHNIFFSRCLRGMYAIAIYDESGTQKSEKLNHGQLVLSRDPFGIKPLYYVETKYGLVFASETQALLATGLVSPQIDYWKAYELLILRFSTGEHCIQSGIRRISPGETVVITGGQIVTKHKSLALPTTDIHQPCQGDPLVELEVILREVVALYQSSDVPCGIFLSGGIDSTILLVTMARLNVQPVLAFTAWFSGSSVPDERVYTRTITAATGAESVEVLFTEADFWSFLPDIAAIMDDPTADYAILPTYKLAYEARKTVKVVLTGEGGDELFAGYGRYRKLMWHWMPLIRKSNPLKRLGLLRQEHIDRCKQSIFNEITNCHYHSATRLQMMQIHDCCDWLPYDLLSKLDRCLMAHGLEGRIPFLDPRLVQFAWSIPDRLKIRNNMGKWLLRHWLSSTLPDCTYSFQSKRGFSTPISIWISKYGRTLGSLVANIPAVSKICYPEAVRDLFAISHHTPQTGLAAWTLLFYALWVRYHIEGVPIVEDVFTLLEI